MGAAPAKAKGDGVEAVSYSKILDAGDVVRGVTLFEVALFADDDDGHDHPAVLELWEQIRAETLVLGQVRRVADFKSRAQRAFKANSVRGSGTAGTSASACAEEDAELCTETAARSVARLMIMLICDPASKRIASVAQGALSLYNRERPMAVTVAAARIFADLFLDLQALTLSPTVGLAGTLADALRSILRQSAVRKALGAGTARALVRYAFAELDAATPAALLRGGAGGSGVLLRPSEAVDGALTLTMNVYSIAREAAVNECSSVGGSAGDDGEVAVVELATCLACLGCSEEEARIATRDSLPFLFQRRRVVLEALLGEVAWSKDVYGKARFVKFHAYSMARVEQELTQLQF